MKLNTIPKTPKEVLKAKKQVKQIIDEMDDKEFIDSFCIDEQMENYIFNDNEDNKLPF